MNVIITSVLGRRLLALGKEDKSTVGSAIEMAKGLLNTKEQQEMGLFFYQFFWLVLVEKSFFNEWKELPHQKKKNVCLVDTSGTEVSLITSLELPISRLFNHLRDRHFILNATEDRDNFFVHPAKAIF